jgi:hypothetical protein
MAGCVPCPDHSCSTQVAHNISDSAAALPVWIDVRPSNAFRPGHCEYFLFRG